MEKQSAISYKVYPNERLNQVNFHGKEMYPLYIQVIYDRRPIYFKSYFFDLLSKEKYALNYIGGKKTPAQNEIIAKEESVINFLIERQKKNFNLSTLQNDYGYYSKDLLNLLDDSFKDYLVTFFEDQGQAELAMLIKSARETITSARLVSGFKTALKPQLFKLLLENAPSYGSPYLPLYDFLEKRRKQFFYTLSVYEWEECRPQVGVFLKKKHLDYSYENVQAFMKKLLRQ